MTVQGPHVLNALVSLDLSPFSILITSVCVILCSIISFYFFRSYRFCGVGYLLGLPMGFALLGISFVFEHITLIYYGNNVLYQHVFFWTQLALQSEALALIAVSYILRGSVYGGDSRSSSSSKCSNSGRNPNTSSGHDLIKFRVHHTISNKTRVIVAHILTSVVISAAFMVPISALFMQPYLNVIELADFSFYVRIFDMTLLGYIFISAIMSLVKAGVVKLLLIPAAFGLLWLEQYSLLLAYLDDSSLPFVASIIARMTGLALFVYSIHHATSGRITGEIEIQPRENI
jgi:hypothetical protein